jgi:glutathione S-transferase
MNPNGTVPVIRDGDMPALWESGAILRYLAGRYATAPFWPTDSAARANVDRWAEWAKINVSLGFTAPIFWRVVRTAPKDQDPTMTAAAVARFETVLSIAEDQLAAHEFLACDDFTLADIQFGHILYRYYDIAIDRQPLPNLARYYNQLQTRQMYRDHVMISYEDLRVL